MFRELTVAQARRIATLAKAAREARDAILGNLADMALGEPPVSRGEHNPASVLGFDPLPPDTPQIVELLKAITLLTPAARSELFTLMKSAAAISRLAIGPAVCPKRQRSAMKRSPRH